MIFERRESSRGPSLRASGQDATSKRRLFLSFMVCTPRERPGAITGMNGLGVAIPFIYKLEIKDG